MKVQRKHRRHRPLILVLTGLMCGITFMPAGVASAQVAVPSWSYTGNLNTARDAHTATLLQNGKVLVAGGADLFSDFDFPPSIDSAELYDPATGTWSNTGNLTTARQQYTATLLPNGKVLVAGGIYCELFNGCYLFNSTELYDPATGTWSPTGNLITGRSSHTATLLPDGKVLVAGDGTKHHRAEVYDPTTGAWSYTGNLSTSRFNHTATLLPGGKVLVAGGAYCTSDPDSGNSTGCFYLNSAELYDPSTGTWSSTGSLNAGHAFHTATLLPSGKVLVTGGWSSATPLDSAELYDPATGTWTSTGNLNLARGDHTATLLPNGKVLVAGGANGDSLNSAELYDSASGTWSITASLNSLRRAQTTTLLLNGKVLVVGGSADNSAELYNPGTDSTPTPTATPTPTPSPTATPTVTPAPTPTATPTPAAGPTWSITGSLNNGRDFGHTATLLSTGKVLVAGGAGTNGSLNSAELYDSVTGTWQSTGNLNAARDNHTATLLPNGRVMVAGGFSCAPPPASCLQLNSAELYNPATGTWSNTGNLNAARDRHTATLLPNGKILVAGGFANAELNSAELYDPGTGIWSGTGSLNSARYNHAATLLQNGKVLVVGGDGASKSAELYDPATGTWSITGNLNTAHTFHTATILPNGKVLVAAGFVDFALGQISNIAELFDPVTGSWSITGNLNTERAYQTATLLVGGKVLVSGGFNMANGLPNITNSAELYDPATGTWSNTANLNIPRRFHTATLLLNGKVLASGGTGGNASELYDPGANPIDDAQFFVRQQYLNFLNREPDQGGWDYWTSQITSCSPNDQVCINERRVAVADAFFFEPEFQQTASYVFRLYRLAFGDNQAFPNPDADPRVPGFNLKIPKYSKFIADRAQVVGGANLPQGQLDFANAFVQRSEFLAKYPAGLSPTDFINAVIATITGANPSVNLSSQQSTLLDLYNQGGRGAVIYRLADDNLQTNPINNRPFIDAEYNLTFVANEYFGYLGRDGDTFGMNFWLTQINSAPLRDVSKQHAMVCSFITSTEYQQRFGSTVTRSNADCGQ